MPRIDDAVLDCTVYLYGSVGDAERGNRIGGTGFLIDVPAPAHGDGLSYVVCVTNRHVVEAGFTVARLNSIARGIVVAEFDERHWTFHAGGADLAVAIMPAAEMRASHKVLTYESLVTQHTAEELHIGVGDEIFLVGRFINHDGGQTNTPTARFGNIAQMPGRPVAGDHGVPQESYLIECRSIGGFSGSPVFLHIPPFAWRPSVERVTTSYFGPALLGVEWCHTCYREEVLTETGTKHPGNFHVAAHSGLSGVVPSWHLLQLIESEQFRRCLENPLSVELWGTSGK